MRRAILITAVACLFGGAIMANTWAQQRTEEGTGEQIGEKIDQGVRRIGEQLRHGWHEVRKGVDKLSVQGRVYGRLHWDKALEHATLEIQMRDATVVVLKGSVPDLAAKGKAVVLAQDTVGVSDVVDELAIAPAK